MDTKLRKYKNQSLPALMSYLRKPKGLCIVRSINSQLSSVPFSLHLMPPPHPHPIESQLNSTLLPNN